MDAATQGQIIRRARTRRGLSQAVLAGLIGRSESWLSQVERGKHKVNSHDVLTRLAEVLPVSVADLTGGEDEAPVDRRFAGATQIERAMLRYTSLESIIAETGEERTMDVARLQAEADRAYADYQATRYAEVARRLPRLIRDVEAAARGRRGDRPVACSARAQVYNTAAAVLKRVGRHDLAWQAADRAMSAAEWADDTLLAAVGAYRLAYVLVSRKRPAEAADLAMGAAYALERRMRPGTAEELSVYGGLHLAAATAAAAEYDRAAIPRFLAAAGRAADRLGGDFNHHGTAFGPTNVEMHRISTAVAVGDAQTAIDAGEVLDPSSIPVGLIGRRVQVKLDIARGYTQRRMDSAAVNSLLEAEAMAPQLVRHDPATFEVLTELLRREHRPSTPELRPLCQRAGVA
ncbi:helix-turn-helix domain-containing protein [Streptomonospora nanhaiensis]|uniref:Transcriptional regulator with XRE-family HTH domain n=1 Tax=Streptomonospora nanhaiensis TaxID=1323731 RepID=A0A853BRD3_9ACTN|nr:helix-turn-helix transcriptional regulator [Streptomonospora nanhaiensis]MBV2365981.1 helix-turn-helix domain-containing protein [Streptomonospora nanhaiensis]MBX9388838.1 helix-turn-helix domain-containing protein [Streptomonospora nanhaiensis]NYI98299.1 transcriptional regulator with XRE-family HTH domain [Streptomonospora nanhaiensis]